MMNAGIIEASTPPSPSSPAANSSEGKRRKKKKSGSKDKTSPVKEKKVKSNKSPSKGDAGSDDDINTVSPLQKHSSPRNRDEVDRASRIAGKANQDIEWLMTENIRDLGKSSILPPSPTSPADSVFEEPPFSQKREHSKSRSRSGSRSRLSGLFKRKKQRSRSETDVNREDDDVTGTQERSPPRDWSRRAKSASSNRASAVDKDRVGAVTTSGTFPRKANLKRESPHHAYDSRVQPRDRLLNMTVKDAAKEHRLRRVDSGGLLNRRSRQEGLGLDQCDKNYGRDMSDATYPLYPDHFSTSSLSRHLSVGGASADADYQQTSALVHNTTTSTPESSIRSSTLPRFLRSKSSSYAPYDYTNSGGDVRIEHFNVGSRYNIPRNSSTPAFLRSAIGLSDDQLNVSQENRILAQIKSDDTAIDSINSAQDTKITVDEPRPKIGVESQSMGKDESVSGADTKDSKRNKRKTSLSKFLELRQAVPSGLALTRRTSQSSDSGVTSRDTSPGTSVIRRHTRQDRDAGTSDANARQSLRSRASTSELPNLKSLQTQPNSGLNAQRRSTNPYVVSSVEIPDPSAFAAPRLYLNGTNLEASDTQQMQQPLRQADTGNIDNNFIYSNPAMETSQTSSYRSSDQGFVESEVSEVSDADVEDIGDDDNSDFSTPPEEVEPYSPTSDDSSMHFATPQVLEKLLEDTQKQIHQGRRLYASDNRDNRNNPNKAMVRNDRYVPRGVRRSNSDRENTDRATSPRRTFRKGPSFSDSPRETTKLSESVETLKELPSSSSNTLSPAELYHKRVQDEECLSSGSTSTLTNLDSAGYSSSEPFQDPQRTQERPENTHVPRMGMSAQHRYRRTFSPVRANKALVPTPEEDPTGPYNTFTTAPFPTSPPPSATPVSQLTMNAQLSPIITIPASSPTPTSVPSSQHYVSSSTTSTPKHRENYGAERAVVSDIMSQRDGKMNSAAASLNPDQSSKQPFVERLASLQPLQDSLKASSVLLGRNTSLSSGKADHFTTTADFSSSGNSNVPLKTHSSLAQSNETGAENAPLQKSVPTEDVGESKTLSDTDKNEAGSALSSFPIIHGLELASDKEGKFKGKSLSDFIHEQSRAQWQRLGLSKKEKTDKSEKSQPPTKKEKSQSPTKREKSQSPTKLKREKSLSPLKREKSLSPSAKAGRKTLKQQQKKAGDKPLSSDVAVPVGEFEEIRFSGEVNGHKSSEKFVLEQRSVPIFDRTGQETGMRIVVDKGCQTSTWLINSLVKAKPKKFKKKASSFTKSKSIRRRRDSAASDTHVPANLSRQRRGATQWSSLGDVRVVAAYEDRHRSESPEKKLKRSKSDRTSKRSINDGSITGSSNQGRSRIHSVDSDQPKSKKLSLTAIILLKNKLAKVKKRKSKDRENCEAAPEEEEPESDVPSDTMMTIENEINLSKLEVSKETDIVDDDIFEPEFSLDCSKRQIHFDDMPPSEPMQSEEPLPPLPPQASRRMRQRRESTMRERRRKCVSYCKKFIAFLFSHIGLCSLVVAYTIMGGFIFQYIENDKDMDSRRTVTVRRSDMIGRLISLAVDFKASENSMQNLTAEVQQYVQDFQDFIYQKVKNEAYDGKDEGVWSFASSMLYAITVTTTIGYGHVAPKTTIGRLVTIGYAVVGIPLTLLCLTNIGDVMATGFRLLYGKVCCGVCCTLFKPRRRTLTLHPDLEKGMGIGRPVVTSNEDDSPDKSKEVIHVPTSLCLLLIAGYIIAGAMLFASWEKWDMLTGSYFCFITLSTIGFGDIVPGMDSGAWAQEEKLVLCALYLVLGLSLIAMCFNLVQEDVKAKCKWLGMKLGIVEKPKAPI